MFKKLLLSTALVMGFASAASAGTLTYDDYSWTGLNIQVNTPNSIYGGAGPITLYEKGKSLGTFWCMDVDNYLAGAGHDGVLPFTLASVTGGLPGVPTTLSQTQLSVIDWLVTDGAKVTDPTLGAAIQVAIWEEEYGDAFSFNSLGSGFDLDVSNDIAIAVGNASTKARPFSLNFYVPGDPSVSQTLISGTSAVPEPSTWAMGVIGFGMVALLALRRRAGMSVA